jgi:hypothetical protein
MFKGRSLVIATKHKKEDVIAPAIEAALSVTCFVNDNFDTDELGTFSGEIERKLDPLSTARQKCLLAMELSNCDLGIASEGSFGAHPSIPFGSADDELLIFIDKKNHLEVVVRELSMDTNFNGKTITNEKDLLEFAELVKFPSHGLILRKSKQDTKSIIKGITHLNDLLEGFHKLYDSYGSVFVETDMRALFNPSRMSVIETATHKLVEKIKSCCPNCNLPGFGVTDVKKGLPCALCGGPTSSTLSFVYQCKQCNFKNEALHPHDKTEEDPMYCDFCNP